MKKTKILFWLISIFLTLFSIVYQRITGPTYPVKGNFVINDTKISFKFSRSHAGKSDHKVSLFAPISAMSAELEWRRYKTKEEWKRVAFIRNQAGDSLIAFLPYQPPAGKLEYRVIVKSGNQIQSLPENPIVIRFRGEVPQTILILHIVFIFLALAFSTRAGLEFFNREDPKYTLYAYLTLFFMFFGGLIFGPLMQYHAFGEYWTGFPFGIDLTDNKTIFAFIFWCIAAIASRNSEKAKYYILFASIVTFIVFLIPHSLLGSELDYSKLDTTLIK